ncbi:hypothetical protein cypCar_00035497, partial [Cyprinus carpio]
MFTSQTSSFQESLDVDERDADFDNEEIAGYSQNIQQINSYYAIYYYQNTRCSGFHFIKRIIKLPRSEASGDSVAWSQRRSDSTTSQEDFSLPAEAEPELRSYISRRLSKGALLGGMGNIATVEL